MMQITIGLIPTSIILLITTIAMLLASGNGISPLQNIEAQDNHLNFSFVEKWGTNGSGPGKFDRPHDIAFDSLGFVYVSDRELNNIQKFTHNGSFIKMWGTKGTGDGQFKIPYSIGIDPKDRIYVVDRENHRIEKFDTNGTFLGKIGNKRGNADNQFNRPEDIAFSTFGIFVTDTGNDRILKFNNSLVLEKKWGSKGTGDGQFIHPHAIDVDSKGDVYVGELDRPGVQVFDSEGNFLKKWGSKGTGDGQFSVPQEHLAVDEKDRVYIVDGADNPRVQVFDTNGNFLGKIGSYCQMSTGEGCIDPDGNGPLESGDGQFSKPEHVSIDSQGNVYVVDRGNKRIQVFTSITN
jgi:DNA-binding beta-propeller fold protein YncE